ncbi:MAG: ferritin-like domain-containing protein [Gemmatimonadaceae bacterium]
MNSNDTILESIDPDIADRLIKSSDEIAQGRSTSSWVTAALAMGSVPIALAALSKDAFGQTAGSVQDVLNFALMLEIFENEFYKAVLNTSSVAAQNAAFATVRAKVPASAAAAIGQIQKHETAHVATLTAAGAVNVLNLTAASFDFTGARGAGNGPFLAATTDLNFLLLTAQGAEDTGVRAYKGQAGNLMSNSAVLESALRIHSVEARHASKIRRLRRQTGGPTSVRYSGTVSGGGAAAAGADNVSNPPAGAVAALGLIYAGEDNTTQGGVNVAGLPNLPTSNFGANAASEAFDEPLTKAQVIAIVQGFFIPLIPA